MTRPPGGALYSPQLLALAVELADYPFDQDAPLIGEARSRSCGSTLAVSAQVDLKGIGLRVVACAVGQASAAIFARHAEGRDRFDLQTSLETIVRWLTADGPMPDWPDIELLAAARDYPGRHDAILLPWRAALDALSKAPPAR